LSFKERLKVSPSNTTLAFLSALEMSSLGKHPEMEAELLRQGFIFLHCPGCHQTEALFKPLKASKLHWTGKRSKVLGGIPYQC